ncbi:MAG: ATP-dependent RNA helicase Dbp10 [Amphiamblys sp. WSBS2006]|nr:MAG: ATP-dependent RNA helicase Dbp10 [Amphiamblys sp. WSBS2006]
MPEKGKKGFYGMGLEKSLLNSVLGYGYKTPTPIQRKAIPAILKGGDVIAAARTGAGKTAAFLIPLVQRLKQHSPVFGLRGLVLAPNRELATQTFSLLKILCKGNNLRVGVVIGGESLEQQFDMLRYNPDVIVATPGRFLHLVRQVKADLAKVECVVFDEGDKLFELGLGEQLGEIVELLPHKRQSVAFSATISEQLAGFTSSHLTAPTFIRLDSENKLSEDTKTHFLLVGEDNKDAVLSALLSRFEGDRQSTLVFCATKQQVDYLVHIARTNGVECSYVYGNMDQEHRHGAMQDLRDGLVRVLFVTDVAARGIDIPVLDNVVNYNFPDDKKLFVHRVGRVGRQGRPGFAYSLVAHEEMPWVVELAEFLGKKPSPQRDTAEEEALVVGTVPQSAIDAEKEGIDRTVARSRELKKTAANSMKMYRASKRTVEGGYVEKAKLFLKGGVETHALFAREEKSTEDLFSAIKAFRPKRKQQDGVKREAKRRPLEESKFIVPVRPSKKEGCFAQSALASATVSMREDNPRGTRARKVNEAGKKISKDKKKEIYKEWVKKTNKRVPKTGEKEQRTDRVKMKNMN